jgi:dihydropteroate synthase
MNARVLTQSIQEDPAALMHRIGVHPEGVRIMTPKAAMAAVYLSDISAYAARILKQDLLSIGADCATAADTLIRNRRTDCLILATRQQLSSLSARLRRQSETLRMIAHSIDVAIKNSDRKIFVLKACNRKIRIDRPFVMGILNITPDSFSGDGLASVESGKLKVETEGLLRRIEDMVSAGVDIFDVGGESSRPGSRPVSVKEELRRVIPIISLLTKKYPRIPVSVDTYKPAVARAALGAGAVMINDITGLKDKDMRNLAARSGAAVCIMHMKGTPRTMQKNPRYADVLGEVFDFFVRRVDAARKDGVDDSRIVLDVGIGFGKSQEDNLRLLSYHHEFMSLGYPLLLGISRKSFIGRILEESQPEHRRVGTVAALTLGIARGARILRVHDVSEAVQAVKVADAILNADIGNS